MGRYPQMRRRSLTAEAIAVRWMRRTRWARLMTLLPVDAVGDIRYQLLHRTVSAIHEAQRYRTDRAIMLVHSFSVVDASFGDFQRFATAMGIPVRSVNQVSGERECDGIRVRLAWVKDQPCGRVQGPEN